MTQHDLLDFLENAADGMHWVGPDGEILWANRAELELLGYSREEYIGRPVASVHCDAATIDDILARLRRNEAIRNYPARLRHRDGSIRDVLISSSVLWRDGEFVHTRCITRDVTEQRRVERERGRAMRHLAAEHAVTRLLEHSGGLGEVGPQLLRTIAEACQWPVGALWTVDGDVLRFVEGWQADGTGAFEFLHESRQLVLSRGTGLPGRIWASGEPAWIDDVLTGGNFPRAAVAARAGLHAAIGFPILLRGAVAGVFEFFGTAVREPDSGLLQLFKAVGTQIGQFIERREIDEVRHRLAAIVDSSDDAIVSKTLDGVITSWNRGAETIFGYTAAEAIGRHISLIIPRPRLHEEDDVLARLRHGVKVDHFETVRQAKDGRLLDVSLTVSPVRNAAGTIVGASKVARDITVWKRAEALLREREQQAQAQVQVRDDFLSIAAHELRNPLNALQLQLVTLHRAAKDADEWLPSDWVADRLLQATGDVASLVRLVHNLLDVARIAAGRLDVEPEDVDFSNLVHAVVRRFGQQLPAGQLVLDAPPITGRSDRLRLEQVVSNLVSNAIKFGAGKPVEVALRADDDRVYLSVTDHGVGIEPARQADLFQRFSRAVPRRQYGGFGLGLWIARETVHAMGGEIWLSSTPGEGSTFSVFVPRVLSPSTVDYAVR